MGPGVAIVGTGRWGERLAGAAGRAGLRLVTCFARDEGARRTFADRFGCVPAPGLEAAVSHPEVEGVLVVTPNDVHEEHTALAARHGRHVFVEKPIADTLEAAERMRAACEGAGVTLMVGHGFRRLGAARRVQELVGAGALGRVVLAEATFSLPGAFPDHAWRAHRERNPGGPIMQLGIHHVDTLGSWLGRVERSTGTWAHVATPADIDDVGVVVLEFATGALGVVTGSYVSPKLNWLRLQGTEAVLEVRMDFSVWPAAEALDARTTVLLDGGEVAFEPRDMLAEELAEFGRCIREGASPETGAAEGIAALRVVLDALGSGRRQVAA